VTFLSCRLQISLTLDFRIFLGTHVFEFECHYNQLPNIHNSTSWVLFFSFLFLRHKWRNSLQRRKKSIIVHHQGDKGVWPHTWPCPSTNKASLLGLLYTPSNKSTSPHAHHYMPTPNLIKAWEVFQLHRGCLLAWVESKSHPIQNFMCMRMPIMPTTQSSIPRTFVELILPLTT